MHAQPTFTTPLRCFTAVVAMHRHVDHWARTKGLTKERNARLSEPVVVVEWYFYSKRIIIDKRADLTDFFSSNFVGKMCIFVSRPMNIVTFLLKNGETAKRVVDFPVERHIPKQNHGNRRGF